ncbi:hypothetical protein Kpol_1053p10 [Vanderwaltozyma polyspora DSM 70294]|uniref:Large ribosomal subunit protein mL59 domain-containing protein n=1 Tax=Vanderwaltozyma polyspora (strain ATCC 22028 / DSM 70294 / BCRC 21397 / CBS 2163 / NBRC 10782 / NRRL Y-8283 / UCD 57-17) TaxID=436907 RepID=A7TN56_VANPO|nr:uncharacterized protein Kpol_1053p10 [Vanderwaltozyma polyspora DSM 70294]EDO16274.1 hypothetical protein Kpol_1053p10 [Vanderwaltozyma polyspora DSM 70294]
MRASPSVMNSVKYFEFLPSSLKTFFNKYPPSIKYATKPVSTYDVVANPFLPNKHPVTGRYHEPKYSKRRMSDLYKMAHSYGIQEFLPPMNKKFFEEKYDKKTFMRGVLTPKGHKHEFARQSKLAKMEVAIKNADKYILDVKGRKYAKKLEEKKKYDKVTWF